MRSLTFPRITRGERRDILYRRKTLSTCHVEKEYPRKLRLQSTKDLTLEEIAQRCKVSRTSVHRLTSAEGREPENRRHFCGRRKKISPEQEALILGSIEELRDQERSFSSRRLMERTGIHHVSDRTARRLLNRNGYFFLQARKKGPMSQSDKDMRVTFARRMQADYPMNVWTDSIAFY